jgi:catechol 2,3-dioxygenase-like lactoylglutathione lyase family enzyme
MTWLSGAGVLALHLTITVHPPASVPWFSRRNRQIRPFPEVLRPVVDTDRVSAEGVLNQPVEQSLHTQEEPRMDMKLELVPIPVSDVDRAKAFYADRLGFAVDVDVQPADGVRVVQLTPPGSACSIGLGTGLAAYEAPPGSVRGLHLVVDDIEKARAELIDRGVEVGAVVDVGGGVLYAAFEDLDGNGWTLQYMPWRTGDAF